MEHDIDVSRGDTIVGLTTMPGVSSDLRARVAWMNTRPLQAGRKYFLKHTTQTVQAVVTSLENRLKIADFETEENPKELGVNDLGEIRVRTSRPLVFDSYSVNRLTGSFILIEPGTNQTVGAGMLFPPTEPIKPEYTDFAI